MTMKWRLAEMQPARGRTLGVAFSVVLLVSSASAQVSGVFREVFLGLSREGMSLARLTNHPSFLSGRPDQTNTLASLQTEQNRGDDYGQRLRAYLTAPATGDYVFSIASDETSHLYLGADDDPETKRLVAWVDPRSQPNVFTTHFGQQSQPVPLIAGRRYYLEVLHHEANLIDTLSVQWRLPSGTLESPIPGSRLAVEIPPKVVADLADVTIEEGRPLTLAPRLANFLPQQWRWERDSVVIPDAAAPRHRIARVSTADDGAVFRAFITNRLGGTSTAPARLTVVPDVTPPTVAGAWRAKASEVWVRFSEPVAPDSAAEAGNYRIAGVSISSADLGADGDTVILRTGPLPAEADLLLAVSNVVDQAGAANVLAGTQLVFRASEFNSHAVGGAGAGGAIQRPGGNAPVAGAADVQGQGRGTDGRADEFQFGWQSVEGDFDVRVRVEELAGAHIWASGGLMARESLEADSRFAAALATPSLAGAFFQYRTNAGWPSAAAGSGPLVFPDAWLRLRRSGDEFLGFCGADGSNWQRLGGVRLALPARVYLGLMVSSRDTNVAALAKFRDYSPAPTPMAATRPPAEPPGPSSRRTGLVISEIMYHPRDPGPGAPGRELEFVEIFNSNPFAENLSGHRLSGDIDYTFPPGTVLEGGGYRVVARNPADLAAAYGLTGVLGPFTNNLPNRGGRVRLRNENGFVLLEVNYAADPPWPVAADGAGPSLVLARPSYGENHRSAWAASAAIGGSPGRMEPSGSAAPGGLVINEILAHTVEPLEDFIELHNPGATEVDAGGLWLSDNPATNKFRLPSPTLIPAGGYVSFAENELGFALSSAGERVFLVNSNQDRVIDAVGFGPQASGVASGRTAAGAPGFRELSLPTPGAANAPALSRPIVINEIMYHPISEDSADEFLELHNRGEAAVDLGGWRFVDGIEFSFPSNTLIAAGGYLVVAKDRARLLANHPYLAAHPTLVVGDYGGTLADGGERVALAMAELAIDNDDPARPVTNIIHVVVDEVEYRDGGAWGQWSDGGGSSLELVDARADNGLAPNWADSDETAKAPWTTVETTGVLDHGQDAADSLQVMLLEAGECLVDDVEATPQGGGNRIANSSFETGLTGWVLRGTHERSSLAGSGFNSSRSLHVRASAQGDIGPNKIRVPFATAFTAGQTVTLRARARWLKGWPELLLRIRGGYLEATDRLIVPANLGTPGAPNSRRVANAGPAITGVTHLPVLPQAGEPITVTARVSDVDGLSAVVVRYRLDPDTNWVVVPMALAGAAAGDLARGGTLAATIPGQPADTMVAFVVEATDAATPAATARFPRLRDDNGPVRECLVHVGSPVPAGSFGNYRFWITQQSVTNWAQREVLSNERIPGTFVYGNHRVIHEAGARYSGSPAHQDQAAPDFSPVGTPNNYSFEVPRDEPVLGTDNLNKVHGPGNNHHDDNTLLREATAYWMAQRLGLPANYKRFVTVFINGARRGSLMEDTQVPNNDVIEGLFPDDARGNLHKISIAYEFANATTPVLSTPASAEAYLNNYTTTAGAKKTARYRWNFQPRAVHGSASDFTNLFLLIDAASTPAGPAFEANLNAVADVENWMSTFALEHALGNWDSFGYRNHQNMFLYKPERDRWKLLIWDINIIFGGGTRGTPVPVNGDLFEIDAADQSMPKLYNTPAFRRAYWQALQETAVRILVNAEVDPYLDARFAAFRDSGVHVTAPDMIKNWVSQRRAYILAELARADAAAFALHGPVQIEAATNVITLSGVAPFAARTLAIDGAGWPVTWTTPTNWSLRVALAPGTNRWTLTARDAQGIVLPGASLEITAVHRAAPPPSPEGWVVINEIHYHPVEPDTSFVELFNRSDEFAFDLSGWRLEGVDFRFPPGTLLGPEQFTVVAQNRAALARAFGFGPSVVGEFAGRLNDGGETLTLIRPTTETAAELVVDRMRYDDDPPWPTRPDGLGPSLQLIDAAQDNRRAGNWRGEEGWVFVSRTGNIGAATNLMLWIPGGGTAYVDDLSLVGPAGTNILFDGGFETGFENWFVPANYSNSVVAEGLSRSGSRSLWLDGRGTGGQPGSSLGQRLAGRVETNTTYTLSFWCLSHTNSVNVVARTLPGNNLTCTGLSARVYATPGSMNSFAAALPEFPPLWLNEVQPVNDGATRDGRGEAEPWIEVFNAGLAPVSFDGLFLSAGVSNLTEWAFPAGSEIQPGEFKIIWADGESDETAGPEWHASFRLPASAGLVVLSRWHEGTAQALDYLDYKSLGPGVAYGSAVSGDPFDRRRLYLVTPGASNQAPAASVFLNEWMAANRATVADPADGDFEDWVELFNGGATALDLGGFYLTDTAANPTKFRIPPGYVVPPGGFLLVWADEEPGQNRSDRADLHANFRLAAEGETLGLYSPQGALVDAVEFSTQAIDVSEGRFADGAAAIHRLGVPTPRGPNRLQAGNTAPQLATLEDRVVTVGQTLVFALVARDAESPSQVLRFELVSPAPAGASLTPAGLFSWRPEAAQAPSLFDVTVRVFDDGQPSLHDEGVFRVRVVEPPRVVDIRHEPGGVVRVAWESVPDKRYQVEFKDRLDEARWLPLGHPLRAASDRTQVSDQLGQLPQRFYRIVILD